MADVSIDTVYHNSGATKAHEQGAKFGESLDRRNKEGAKHPHNEEARLGHALLAEGTHKYAAETKAFWDSVNLDKAKGNDKYLPKGFTVTEDKGKDGNPEAGHHHVFYKGKEIYNEAAVAQQAKNDTKLGKGESPYAALIRQGMNPVEAAAASRDARDGLGKGNGGFKQGESYSLDQDGKGDWFAGKRKDRDEQAAAEKKAKEEDQLKRNAIDARITSANNAITRQNDFKTGADLAMNGPGKSHVWGVDNYLNKSAIDSALADAKKNPDSMDKKEVAALTAMSDPATFAKISGGKTYINQADLDKYNSAQLAEAQKAQAVAVQAKTDYEKLHGKA